jgi:hypothetical protein
VILVEVRADGVRAQVLELLLSRGLTYVGQVHGRPSLGNEVIDDVYINETHLGIYFPESRVGSRHLHRECSKLQQ